MKRIERNKIVFADHSVVCDLDVYTAAYMGDMYFVLSEDGSPQDHIEELDAVNNDGTWTIEDQKTGIEKLIEALKAVDADVLVEEKPWLTDSEDEDGTLPESIEQVLELAAAELILKSGQCNFSAHRTLGAAGYPVSCGERDSFGWLTGVIKTRKGNIAYG